MAAFRRPSRTMVRPTGATFRDTTWPESCRTLRVLEPRDGKILLVRLVGQLTQDEMAGRVGISQMHLARIFRDGGAAVTTHASALARA
jgi:AraC-like DNA-binding protein